MDTPSFPAARSVGVRRRLLGIPLAELAHEAGITRELLRRLEDGGYDPRSLHSLAARVLEKRLDITL